MPGNLHLRLAEDGLQMADTERAAEEQMDQTQSGPIAETFVNADQSHAEMYTPKQIYGQADIPMPFCPGISGVFLPAVAR